MTPVRLRIQNFRSFKKEQEFELPTAPGLYFMTGTNESEPRLGSNGAGKSTVWDALFWCLFNRTPRGLRAGDVCNWEAGKGTRVELDFELPGVPTLLTVARTWGPISWKLEQREYGLVEDLTDKGENPVLNELRLGPTPFLMTALMAQGQALFLDMAAGPQAELFSDVMGLDNWLEAAARATKKTQDADLIARTAERRLATAEGVLRALGEADDASFDVWEAECTSRLNDLQDRYDKAIELSTEKEDLAAAEKAEDEARAAVADLNDDKVKAALKKAREDLKEKGEDVALLLYRSEAADEQLGRAERGEDCQECGRVLGVADKRAAKDKYDDLMTRLDESEALLQAAQDKVILCEGEVEAAEKAGRHARDAFSDARRATQQARGAKERYERMLDDMEDEEEKLKAEVNPYLAARLLGKEKRRDAVEEVDAAAYELAAAERLQLASSYWVRGFKDVRLGLIAEALAELEVEVNSGCEALGLVGWELRFRVDRETKSGSVKRGFSVGVKSPLSDREVPWEAWSGGESQRLRLAAQMGLADLVRGRTATRFQLEVWDEPTAGLHERGAHDLLEALAARAVAESRPIWLIDHHTHAWGGFSGGAVVVKTPSGSRVKTMPYR